MNADFNYFDFILPTKVTFGLGKIEELPAEIKRNGFERVGIVTNVAAEMSLALDKLVSSITNLGADVEYFTDVVSNPHLETVAEGVHKLEDFSPDCLIGIGGGSALDCAKAIGLCLAHRTDDITGLIDEANVENLSVPVIEIPTTSGTGSEVNYWAVISDVEKKEKLSIGHPEMSPHLALVDPELTLTLPPKLTLWTGIDAFTHAVEAYFSSLSSRLSDLLSLEAISLVFDSLDKAIDDGKDLEARGDMSLASLLAGAAMQHVGLGLIHAMSHQVSGFYDTNHGMTNAILLPEVLEYNKPAIKHKMKKLNETSKVGFHKALEEIYEKYEIGEKKIEINQNDLPIIAERAKGNVNAQTNPRKAKISDLKQIYKKCFKIVSSK